MSAEGRKILTGCSGGKAHLWGINDGGDARHLPNNLVAVKKKVLDGHSAEVRSAVIRGNLAVTGARDAQVILWDSETGNKLGILKHSIDVRAITMNSQVR